MAILTIPQLKALWVDGFIPDQNDYADLFDSIEALGDPNALSLDTAAQIDGLLLKATPVGADVAIIEDSEDSFNKKKILLSTLLGGGASFTGSQGINLVGSDFQLGGIIDTEAEITINETVNEEESLTFSGSRLDGGAFSTIISPAGFFTQTTDGADGSRSSIQSDNTQASLTALGNDFSGRILTNGDTGTVSLVSADTGMAPEETSIILNPDGMFIKTPAVEAGTATATQVLSLVNAATGQVEFATVSGGGGGDLLAANNLSDVDNAITALSNLGGARLAGNNLFSGVINTFNNLVEVTSHIALTGTGGTAQAGKIFFAPITTPSGTGTGSGNSQLSAGSNGELVWLGSGNPAVIFDNSAITDARTYGLPDADGTLALTSDIPSTANFVTTDTSQTINVNKTFGSSANVTVERFLIVGRTSNTSGNDGKILLTKRVASSSGIGDGTFSQIYADIDGAFTIRASGKNDTIFDPVNITAQRRYTLPDADGTLALDTDLAGFVTLAGNETVSGLKTHSAALRMGIGIQFDDPGFDAGYSGGGSISYRTDEYLFTKDGIGNGLKLNLDLLGSSPSRTLQVPNKNGIIATTDDITVDDSSNQTIGGNKTFTGQSEFQGPIVTPPTILTSVAGVIDWTGQEGSSYEITLTEDTVWNNPSAPINHSEMRIRIRQDGTGLHTLTFGSNFNFPGGITPSITPDPNAKDYLTIVVDGTDLDAVEVQNFL